MKNKKWFNYALSILLTLVVLAVVAGAGIRVGMMQGTSFARPTLTHDFDRVPHAMQGNTQDGGNPHATQGSFQTRGMDDDNSNDRRDGGFPFLSPIFGLIRLAVLGLLVWVGYTFVKKSGWRLTRAQASPVSDSAPVASETPSAEVEEEKAPE